MFDREGKGGTVLIFLDEKGEGSRDGSDVNRMVLNAVQHKHALEYVHRTLRPVGGKEGGGCL